MSAWLIVVIFLLVLASLIGFGLAAKNAPDGEEIDGVGFVRK